MRMILFPKMILHLKMNLRSRPSTRRNWKFIMNSYDDREIKSLTDIKSGPFKSWLEAQNDEYSLHPDSVLSHQEIKSFAALSNPANKNHEQIVTNYHSRFPLTVHYNYCGCNMEYCDPDGLFSKLCGKCSWKEKLDPNRTFDNTKSTMSNYMPERSNQMPSDQWVPLQS